MSTNTKKSDTQNRERSMASSKSKSKSPSNITERVEKLLAGMTLDEKIGQMTQVEKNSLPPDEVKRYFIGSVLSGGGGFPTNNTPAGWLEMTRVFEKEALETRLGIPILYGVDAVHGHNNVVGATIFPHNIGLGATRDPELVKRIGRATALEIGATGVHWNFAPCVAVPQDIRWGRTYEAYSEDTELVATLGVAYVSGLQNDQDLGSAGTVLACPKHFVGDGGTIWGTTKQSSWITDNLQAVNQQFKIDQGDAKFSEAQLRNIHLKPYIAAINAGVRTIMISFSSWHGVKLHANYHLLTEILKGEIGFTGFLVSDWQAIDQIDADYYKCVVKSINAGMDMIMVPIDYQRFISTLKQAVDNGAVSRSRIDDAVRRILTVKFEMGLFDRTIAEETSLDIVGCENHRLLAREAVRKSLVLLKNEQSTIPLNKNLPNIIIAGSAADNIGLQCGGWTIEWQGGIGNITLGTSFLDALRQTVSSETKVHFDELGNFADGVQAEVGIVCIHEIPYAEGFGDRGDLTLNENDINMIQRVRNRCQKLIIIIFSGRPLIITDQLPIAEAWVAAWLPGTEAQGITEVIFGDYPAVGKLSFSWPRSEIGLNRNYEQGEISEDRFLFPLGHGLK